VKDKDSIEVELSDNKEGVTVSIECLEINSQDGSVHFSAGDIFLSIGSGKKRVSEDMPAGARVDPEAL